MLPFDGWYDKNLFGELSQGKNTILLFLLNSKLKKVTYLQHQQ